MKLKKKSVTGQNSIVNSKAPTKEREWDDYTCTYAFVKKPVNIAYIEKLASELADWARTTEVFKVSEFYTMKGIHHRDWGRWIKKHECLKDAVETAQIVLGNRREIGALKKVYDSGLVKVSMKLYDEEWKSIGEESDESKTTVVIMEKSPDSPLVPQKKKKR